MSSPILPPQAPTVSRSAPTGPARSTRPATTTAGVSAAEPAVSLDTFPAGPPAEVLEQMGTAARAYDALQAQGRELSFSNDTSGRTQIQVRDRRSGEVLQSVSPSEALDIAAGKPLS